MDIKELKKEIERAKEFEPALSEYIVANTGRKDAMLEQFCRNITETHKEEGYFSVAVIAWIDILLLLEKHDSVARQFYPFMQNQQIILNGENSDIGKHWKHLKYSFTQNEYVNPLIIEELIGWISDPHETIVSIDLTSANNSNRFSEKYSVKNISGVDWVLNDRKQEGFFQYRHLGVSPSGIHILYCCSSGGGSGIFHSVVFLVLQKDNAILFDEINQLETRERVLLKTLGGIPLGDRYCGYVSYKDNILHIEPALKPLISSGFSGRVRIKVR